LAADTEMKRVCVGTVTLTVAFSIGAVAAPAAAASNEAMRTVPTTLASPLDSTVSMALPA
jgi:hypothetical protein